MLLSIHRRLSVSKIQPMGLRGRLEAIKAPTTANARKSTWPNRPTKVRLTAQLLGTCADRASTYSGMLAKNKATDRAASDHASQNAKRRLIPPTPRPCCLASSAITLLYSTAVSQTLRRDVPREYSPTPAPHEDMGWSRACGGGGHKASSPASVLIVNIPLIPSQGDE